MLPSLQQALGDLEGQVYQTGQLDQLDQQNLSHQGNPVSVFVYEIERVSEKL